MTLRILHVTPYAPDAWAYGGIPRLAGTLARELGRRGHDVTVCTTDACDAASRLPRAAGRAPRFESPPPIQTSNGVRLRVFPNLSNHLAYHQQLFLPMGLGAYLRQHAGDFDVAHLHACRNSPGAIAAHYLRRAGVPYVLAPNGTAPNLERRRLAKRVYDAWLGRRILQGAARVLAVTHAEQSQLQALGVPANAVSLIPNPVDLDEFQTAIPRGRFRQRLGLRAEPLVLFLGKLTPRKRTDVLARACARLGHADARLVIGGNDMGSGAGLRSLLAELGLDRRAIFTGLLRGRERLEALADADVVVYPSQDEIFGLVPLEALLSGTPVIVADDCGCGEVIRAVGGGQVTRLGDVDELAAAIDRTLDAPTYWRTSAAEAAARVRAAYGHEAVCAQIDRLYRDVVGRAS